MAGPTISGTVSSVSKFTHANTFAGVAYAGNPGFSFQTSFSTTDITKGYYGTLAVTTTPMLVDLTAQTDAYGNPLTFATVKYLQIWNTDPTASVTVGGGTNALFPVLPVLGPKSCLTLTTPLTVDATHKVLQLVGTGAASVNVMAVGL